MCWCWRTKGCVIEALISFHRFLCHEKAVAPLVLVAGLLICLRMSWTTTELLQWADESGRGSSWHWQNKFKALRHTSLWQCDEDDPGCRGFSPWPSPAAAGPVSPGSPPGPGLSSWPTSASSLSSSWHSTSLVNLTWMPPSLSQVYRESLA